MRNSRVENIKIASPNNIFIEIEKAFKFTVEGCDFNNNNFNGTLF
jgi:hypothetical protein